MRDAVLIVVDADRPKPGEALFYNATGYSAEPCPACGQQIGPGHPRAVIPGQWRPHHADCLSCTECGGPHLSGLCLI